MDCYIDFDDTLVDRTLLSDDIYKAFGEISVAEMKQRYADFRLEHHFSIDGFCLYLKQFGLDGDRLRGLYQAFAQKTDRYVFSDSVEFLTRLKESGNKVILLTFDAEPEFWQWPKIHASGLEPFFDDCHVVQTKKADILRSWNIPERFVFIDDKQTEITSMQQAFPKALCLHHPYRSSLLEHLSSIMDFS